MNFSNLVYCAATTPSIYSQNAVNDLSETKIFTQKKIRKKLKFMDVNL